MQQPWRIHVIYIISFLVLTIILLLTVKWGGIQDLAERITFALTLMTLILALLAIVYAFLSNQSFGSMTERLHSAAAEVASAVQRILTTAEGLDTHLTEIPSRLGAIEEKFDKTQELLSQSKARTPAKKEEPGPPGEIGTDNDVAEYFLDNSSIGGLLTLYAAVLSYTKPVGFDLEELTNKLPYLSDEYAHGFLVATACSQLIDYQAASGVFSVVKVHQLLVDKTEKEMTARCEKIEEEMRDVVEVQKATIDEHFQR